MVHFLATNILTKIIVLKFSLFLALGALVSFMITAAFNQLSSLGLAGYAALFGSVSLLGSFVALLVAGIVLFVKLAAISFWDYFSQHQRLSRRMCFYVNRHEQISRLFHFKKMRAMYVNQQKYKALSLSYEKKAFRSQQ